MNARSGGGGISKGPEAQAGQQQQGAQQPATPQQLAPQPQALQQPVPQAEAAALTPEQRAELDALEAEVAAKKQQAEDAKAQARVMRARIKGKADDPDPPAAEAAAAQLREDERDKAANSLRHIGRNTWGVIALLHGAAVIVLALNKAFTDLKAPPYLAHSLFASITVFVILA